MTTTRGTDVPTNRERTSASRQRILDAAVRCLVEQGYAAASTVQIQERAGVSRGRLLHHFPSRDELLVAAAEHLAATRVAALRGESAAAITAADGDPARIDQAVEQMWPTFHQPYFWAAVELWIAARHNDEIRTILGPMERRLYRDIRQSLASLFGADVRVQRSAAGDPHLAQWKETAHTLLAA